MTASARWSAMVVLALGWTAVTLADAPALKNQMCPVLTDEAVDPKLWVEHKGGRVYFCCKKCLLRFQHNPAKYAEGLAQVMLVGSVSSDNHHDDNKSHDHGTDNQATEDQQPVSFARLISYLGKMHPMVVHFPIALLVAGAAAELLLMLTSRPMFAAAARYTVWFGAVSALVSAALGWCFGGFSLVDGDWLTTTHRWVGTGTALWVILIVYLSYTSERKQEAKWRMRYRAALFVGAGAVSAAGFFGGALVYGLDHLAW